MSLAVGWILPAIADSASNIASAYCMRARYAARFGAGRRERSFFRRQMASSSSANVASSSMAHRALLQGDAPKAVLPDFFGLPSCSPYGSYNTTWLRNAPRWRLGLPEFGPKGLPPDVFHPYASSYLEPLIVLAIPGILLWMILGITLVCYCYRRYHLGLCGEPFPTVKEYTPKQVAATRLLTAVSFAALVLLAGQTLIVISITFDNAFDSFIAATTEIEELVSHSFGIGRELLATALSILAELDAFDASIAQYVDAGAMLTALDCTSPLLDALPAGSVMLRSADVLQAAIESLPLMNITDVAFALLAYPLAYLPVQLPPLSAAAAGEESAVCPAGRRRSMRPSGGSHGPARSGWPQSMAPAAWRLAAASGARPSPLQS